MALRTSSLLLTLVPAFVLIGCSGSSDTASWPTGGDSSIGGATGNGGTTTQGGQATTGGTISSTSSTGGNASTGGAAPTGGASSIGGAAASGGMAQTGGVINTGGVLGTGGTPSTGGVVNAGGTPSTGGVVNTGGAPSTGGGNAGGTLATGGSKATGGAVATGGVTSNGGAVNTGGAIANTGGLPTTGGAPATGGSKASTGGTPATGGSKATGGAVATGGSNSTGGAVSTGGATGTGGTPGTCSAPTVRITEFDVGATYQNNETDGGLIPLALSPIPAGGTRFAWLGSDAMVHITTLNANDTINTSVPAVTLAAHDFDDIYADNTGGVVLLTRDAKGGGTLNCGAPTNLCGTPPSPAIPCYEMYMSRFDGTTETWATQLTQGSAAHPPYLNSPTDVTSVIFIWWYMHEGRIVSDGTNYAAYYGAAISVTQSGCVNIHQGDEMRVVSPAGAMLTGHNSFDWGCSHSGYERIVWDGSKFVMVCKNDAPTGGKSGQIAFAPNITSIYPIDLYYDNMGDIVTAGGGGYWLTASDIRTGQTANANGLADTRLLHFTTGAPDQNIVLASVAGANDRAPHLAKYGSNMLAVWEQSTTTGDLAYKSTGRTMYLQVLNNTSGAAISTPFTVPSGTAANAVYGNRYQAFKSFPDGSVAYPSAGSSGTKLKVLRVMPCQ